MSLCSTNPLRRGITSIPATLALPFCTLLCALNTAVGQGTFSCGNVRLQNAKISDCQGQPIGGSNYWAEVRVFNPISKKLDGNLFVVAASSNRPLHGFQIYEGRNLGRFHAGTVLVPFVEAGAEASVEIRAWDKSTGETFDTSKIRGSTQIKVQLGGQGQPPAMPGTMTQFTGVRLCPVGQEAK